MTRRLLSTGAAFAALIVAAGCSPSVPNFNSSNSGPSPLMASPTPQVSQGRLPPPPPPPPPSSNQMDTAGNTDGENGDTQMASLEPGNTGPGSSSGGGGSLSRNSVLGAYKVTTSGGNCQIILSLTQWSGGYRAASRGCPGSVADVSAWDVSGNSVVLKNSSGSQVASLASSGGSRFDGQTQGGEAISLYR